MADEQPGLVAATSNDRTTQGGESDALLPTNKDEPPTVPPKDIPKPTMIAGKNIAVTAPQSLISGDSPAQTGASIGVGLYLTATTIVDMKSGTLRYR